MHHNQGEAMKIKKFISMIILLFFTVNVCKVIAECSKEDNTHADKNVTRCTYSQDDLDRMYKKFPDRHESNQCSFCGCAKEHHTKK